MKEFEENKYCKSKNDFIEYITLKNFCRVLKKRKLYHIFRASIGSSWRISNAFNQTHRLYLSFAHKFVNLNTYSVFSVCRTIDDIYDTMRKGIYRITPSDDSDEETKIQYRIVNSLNQLLHEAMENALSNNVKLLSEIGDETFNMTCTELFGENFEDKTPQPVLDKKQIDSLTMEIMSKLNGNNMIMADFQKLMESYFNSFNCNITSE